MGSKDHCPTLSRRAYKPPASSSFTRIEALPFDIALLPDRGPDVEVDAAGNLYVVSAQDIYRRSPAGQWWPAGMAGAHRISVEPNGVVHATVHTGGGLQRARICPW